MISKNNRKAQMQMSVGTIVTIVLLMTVLILGLVLVRTIFTGSIENINSIDQAVKTEINKLFSEDDSRKLIVYPATRNIAIEKGGEGGFAFSVRNTGSEAQEFSYSVVVSDVEEACRLSSPKAQDLIILGDRGTVRLDSGSSLENPILVKFQIPETTPLCNIRYVLNVDDQNHNPYSSVSVDLTIKPS